ncbi:putative leucine-rich repeat domain superfamily [Helianthus debilis subsp. tardiflorus]
MMKHLKSLELKSCWLLEQLTMDFDRLQCLEELRLTDCIQLRDIPNSIRNMKCLRHLHISYCSQVKELPKENLEPLLSSICGLQHFKELTLEGGIPEVPKDLYRLESLEKLSLRMKELKHLPDSICMMKYLKSLDLRYCRSLQDIPDNICNMKCLENLDLTHCIQVENLPEEIGRLESLKKINIQGTGIRSLPQSIYQLKGLRINGSREELKSCGFESLKEVIPGFDLWWYVEL